jgi:hypothetical protein
MRQLFDENGIEVTHCSLIRRFIQYGHRKKRMYDYRWVKRITVDGEDFLVAIDISDDYGNYHRLDSYHINVNKLIDVVVIQQGWK